MATCRAGEEIPVGDMASSHHNYITDDFTCTPNLGWIEAAKTCFSLEQPTGMEFEMYWCLVDSNILSECRIDVIIQIQIVITGVSRSGPQPSLH